MKCKAWSNDKAVFYIVEDGIYAWANVKAIFYVVEDGM
jgi:hypothetical protein